MTKPYSASDAYYQEARECEKAAESKREEARKLTEELLREAQELTAHASFCRTLASAMRHQAEQAAAPRKTLPAALLRLVETQS